MSNAKKLTFIGHIFYVKTWWAFLNLTTWLTCERTYHNALWVLVYAQAWTFAFFYTRTALPRIWEKDLGELQPGPVKLILQNPQALSGALLLSMLCQEPPAPLLPCSPCLCCLNILIIFQQGTTDLTSVSASFARGLIHPEIQKM